MLMNDQARCEGRRVVSRNESILCAARHTCQRFVYRRQGGPNTLTWDMLCEKTEMYIPVENHDNH